MNELMYICRNMVNSENAIRRLNKNVQALAKCNKNLNSAVLCCLVSGLLTTWILVDQDREIKALKKRVTDLTAKVEESNTQEGA